MNGKTLMKPLLAALTLSLALASHAHAQSELSAISVAPVALSVVAVSATGAALSVAPAAILSAGATLVVVSVEVVGGATVWVLERASDGARISLKTSGKLAASAFINTGIAVTVSVVGAGTVLSAAGQVIAFIPNEIGKALLHNEQVTR
jgi:hypothetical protein